MFSQALGMDPRQLARAEEALELAIFQTAYDPAQIHENMQQVQHAIRAAKDERLRDARIMARVASYTEEDDDDGDAFPTKGVKNTRFQGVKKPWER